MAVSGAQFWRTMVAGSIATLAMTMAGFWQSGIGLPALDAGAMLAANMTSAHPEVPYTLVGGNVAHVAIGLVLALLWVTVLRRRVPGNWIVQGFVYGILLTVVAAALVVPLAAGVGIFFSNTPVPVRMLLAAAVTHVTFGLTLTLSLELAGGES